MGKALSVSLKSSFSEPCPLKSFDLIQLQNLEQTVKFDFSAQFEVKYIFRVINEGRV